MKTQYTLLSGETVEYAEPSEPLAGFLRQVLAATKDSTVTEQDLADLVFGPHNPLLDASAVPGRSIPAAATYRDPLFHIMLDCMARKRLPIGEPTTAARGRYTMTVAQAATQLGVSESAIRQAIYSSRLRARKEGTVYYLDPQSVAAYRVSKRGPRRKHEYHGGSPGGILEARIGSGPDASFRVKHTRDEFELDDKHGGEWTGSIPGGWHRIGILGVSKERATFWEIEPAEGESILHFEGFYLRGGFRVVETVSTTAKAKSAFKLYVPK